MYPGEIAGIAMKKISKALTYRKQNDCACYCRCSYANDREDVAKIINGRKESSDEYEYNHRNDHKRDL